MNACQIMPPFCKFQKNIHNSIYHGVAMGYSSSTKFQDKIKGFNERFIMVLIGHIERYLTKVGIDMGLDDKVVYNVTVHKGQAIIATDNASVTATNYFGVDANKLNKLIAEVQTATSSLAEEDQQAVSECLSYHRRPWFSPFDRLFFTGLFLHFFMLSTRPGILDQYSSKCYTFYV